MKTYRAAIIGCGKIASQFDKDPKNTIARSHAGAYRLYPKTELVAGCDLNAGQLRAFQEKWGVKSGYRDHRDMLKKEKIDILSVCTPPETHHLIVKEALEYSVQAIYCEKPISDNVKYAQEMVKACKRRNILLVINHQRRFSPFYQELKKKIENDFLGSLQQVNCFYTRGILNTGIHLLDLFVFLFGPVKWVVANRSQNPSPFKKDPNLDSTICFKNGLSLTMKACDDRHFLILEIDILGTKGRLRLGRSAECFIVGKGKSLIDRGQLVASQKTPFRNAYGPVSLVYGVRHIVNCLESKERPLSSGQDAVGILQIIEAMHRSVKRKKQIFLN